jgi:ribosome-binding factor A
MPRNLPYNRADRVASEVFQIVSSFIYQNMDDDRIERLQITGVKMTKDLSIARIYYYIEGGKDKLIAAKKALEETKAEMRHQIGQGVVLKILPKVEFFVDEGVENAERIHELLKGIKSEG